MKAVLARHTLALAAAGSIQNNKGTKPKEHSLASIVTITLLLRRLQQCISRASGALSLAPYFDRHP